MQQTEPSYDPAELESLADYLSEKQEQILEKWQKAVASGEEDQVSTLASLSRRKFYDNIPDFLKHLRDYLRDEKHKINSVAKKHGTQRWEHGIDLREVILEWNRLHHVLLGYMDRAAASLSLSHASLAEAQRRLARHIHAGINKSVETYYNLLRREADRQVHDLEEVVQRQGEQSTLRGENLQQASHDARGSMTALKINLAMLERTELSDEARQLVQKLSVTADNLNQLLLNLLDLSRLEAGREKPEISGFDAAELLSALCESMQPVAEADGLELRTSGSEQLIVRGDRLKVRRIAQNLLLNAIKYTQEGYVEVGWQSISESQWQISIRDTGPGFDPEQTASFPNVGDRETVSDSGDDPESTQIQTHSEGVGLLIVGRLCELLDGVVEIESEQGTGTLVRVTLPVDY